MAISTNGTVLTRLVGGLYNTTLSNASYTEDVAKLKTAADVNTYANDLYARDFAGKTDLAVANILLANLNLSSVTGLNNWVSAQLTAAGTGNKGAKIISLLNDFSNMDSTDATYGTAVSAFNAKIDSAQALTTPIHVHCLQFHFRSLVPLGRALHPYAPWQNICGGHCR